MIAIGLGRVVFRVVVGYITNGEIFAGPVSQVSADVYSASPIRLKFSYYIVASLPTVIVNCLSTSLTEEGSKLVQTHLGLEPSFARVSV